MKKYTVILGIISALSTLCLSGCEAGMRAEPAPVLPPSQAGTGESTADSETEEIGRVMSPVQGEPVDTPQERTDLISLWGDQVGEDYQWYRRTGRENGPVYYLYVTDPAGNPVPNLNCYTRADWEAGLRGPEHIRGTSMESGLLPVVLSFREAGRELAELTLADPNSGETLSAKLDLAEVGWRYALPVIWEQGTAQGAKEGCIEVSVFYPDGTPASGVVVEAERNGAKLLRFSGRDGTAYFPENALKGGTGGLSITVRDYLERYQEGENWEETFVIGDSGGGECIIMMKRPRS